MTGVSAPSDRRLREGSLRLLQASRGGAPLWGADVQSWLSEGFQAADAYALGRAGFASQGTRIPGPQENGRKSPHACRGFGVAARPSLSLQASLIRAGIPWQEDPG